MRPYEQRMQNLDDVQYLVNVSVGEQRIVGVLDTGSFELVVFDEECAMCGDAALLYDHSESRTYKQGLLQATHAYGSGDLDTVEAFEDVALGPFGLHKQRFWEVTSARMPVLNFSTFQAIVGLGPPNVPRDEAWANVRSSKAAVARLEKRGAPVPLSLQREVEENLLIAEWTSKKPTLLEALHTRRFSLCLGAEPGSEGHFTWNDDAALKQPPGIFTRLPVAGTVTWGLQIAGAGLVQDGHPEWKGPDLGCSKGCAAIVDSGTSLLAAPPAAILALQAAMEDLVEDCSNFDAMPHLVFQVGEHSLSLPPEAYLGHIEGPVPDEVALLMPGRNGERRTRCELLLMKQEQNSQFGPTWVLGMPFFRKYYTTFDLGEGKTSRFLHVALADRACQPSQGASAEGVGERPQPQGLLDSPAKRLRRLDGARLRRPAWAASRGGRSAGEGRVLI